MKKSLRSSISKQSIRISNSHQANEFMCIIKDSENENINNHPIAKAFETSPEDKIFFKDLFKRIDFIVVTPKDNEIIHLFEKRYLYLESVSKRYNDLSLANKARVKEYENCTLEL